MGVQFPGGNQAAIQQQAKAGQTMFGAAAGCGWSSNTQGGGANNLSGQPAQDTFSTSKPVAANAPKFGYDDYDYDY